MKAKKGKKKAKANQKVEEGPRYDLIPLEDVITLENRYNTCIEAVKETAYKIQGIINLEKESKMEKEKEEEWAKYLKCDGLPKACEPTEIREFLEKWDHYDNDDAEKRFSWLLDVNERSVLTQDIDAPNLTKKYLKTKKSDFGDRYKIHIERTLTVLKELKKELSSSKIESQSIYKDLLELKDGILRTIQNTLDKFSFRVVGSFEGFMDAIDSQSSDYCYKCDTFQLHIWGFNDVPITFTEDLITKKEVNLHCILVHMLLPFAVLRDNLVLRGLHLTYDHYSELTKTFDNPEIIPREDDLAAFLKKEWTRKKQLRNKIREKLVKERKEYEEWVQQKEAEALLKEAESKRGEAKGKGKKQKKGVGKSKLDKKKFLVEPLKIDDNMFPDIEKDFKAMEKKQFENFRKSISPESFNLEKGEINLRENTLLGGIYEFNFVGKPKRTIFPNLIMKWLEQPAKLKYKNKDCQLKFVDLKSLGIERSEDNLEGQKGGANDEGIDDKTRRERPKNDVEGQEGEDEFRGDEEPALTFFVITFKVPREICRWSEPIACQWYESQEAKKLDDNETQKDQHQSFDSPKYEMTTPVIINDFVLSSFLERPLIFHIINHLVPRLTSNHQFTEDPSKQTASSKRFTFGQEFEIEEIAKEKHLVSLPPERLFPYFHAVQPIVIVPIEKGSLKPNLWEKTTKLFSKYISELEDIQKSKYPTFKEVQVVSEAESVINEYPLKVDVSHLDSKSRKSLHKQKSTKSIKEKKKKLTEKYDEPADKKQYSFKQIADLMKMVARFKSPTKQTEAHVGSSESDFDDAVSPESDKGSVDSKIGCFDTENFQPKWSTKNIFKSEFNREKLELKLWTNRLGVFAFAFKRYVHLPFTDWSIAPDPLNYKKITFFGACARVKFFIDITAEGYAVEVQGYEKEKGLPVIYHAVENPIPDLGLLKENLQRNGLNIFPQRDAFVYIERALEKLIALEFHTYNCMAAVCMFIKFYKSVWNRITDRRIIIMKCGSIDEEYSFIDDVKITPDECNFVKVKELCTDLNTVILDYKTIRREGKLLPDLLKLIRSAYFRKIQKLSNEQLDNPKLQYNVMTFLKAVRPLSFAW